MFSLGAFYKDKLGRCWVCFHQFEVSEVKRYHPQRVNMTVEVVEGMNVIEGLQSLLSDEAQSLTGL